LLDVTQWNTTLLGYYSCFSKRKVVATKLVVYELESPVLEMVPPLAVGESHQLRCHLANVAPVRNLTLTFLRGEEILSTQNFHGKDQDEPTEVVATHQLKAELGDDG
ncbi:ICAM4 protein, partial [Turnix velox]|nr:ICAM4 protein [Turnix velox]